MSSPTNEPWTIRRIVRWSAEDFAKRGIDSPRLDAELIVAHALGIDRVRIYMDLERELSAAELASIRELVQRRRKREPVAYLVGKKEFWGRSFAVSAAVLVPRPDTETLVERALTILAGAEGGSEPGAASNDTVGARTGVDAVVTQAEWRAGLETHVEPEPEPRGELAPEGEGDRDAAAPDARTASAPSAPHAEPGETRVLDLCTGTGAIGLTIACEVPWARVTITDLSAPALEIARKNLAAFSASDPTLAARVEVREGDLYAALPAGERFELVVCNPPYLAEAELAECEPDVRDHEPALALVSGPRGDEAIVRVIDGARRALEPGGRLLVEIGATQGPRVRGLFERAGFRDVRVHRDLGDRDRVVEGRWAPAP
ncbi:MAG: peptide chain release factor N(5)-glutamine methyltransferase [Sandaracinaceae bacterium]|nr:peptide chain release factor N(5)-glutamine methyltransferase [Sandaracinaceae bacterium]